MDIMSKIINESLETNSYLTNDRKSPKLSESMRQSKKRRSRSLVEKQSVNPGFLMIGQPVVVTVTDLEGNIFNKEMSVGELTAGGGVLVRDNLGYVADLQWDGGQFNSEGNNLLRYFTVDSTTGMSYELFVDRDGEQEGQEVKTY